MSQKSHGFLNTFFLYLRSIFSDIQEVYKNFIHWNLSKIVISLVSFLVGIILSLPFLLLIIILMSLDSIDWLSLSSGILSGQALGFELISQFLASPFFLISEILLLICIFTFFIAGFNYTSFLSARLYLAYKEKKKLSVLRKDYFQREYVTTFLQIFFWQGIYVSVAVGVFMLIGVLLFIISQFSILSFDILSYSLLFALGLCILLGFYITYRVYFAVFLFADSCDVKKPAKQYIQESLSITKGKSIFLFILLFIIFNLVLSPLYFIGDALSQTEIEAKDYLSLKTSVQELSQEDQIYYQYLQEQYTGKSDDQVVNMIMLWNFIGFGFSLFLFLCFEGLLYVVSVWFYKEKLLQEKKSHTLNIFSKWLKKGEL